MSGETILDYTKAEMERVAEAMSSIVAYMEPDADGCRPVYQGKDGTSGLPLYVSNTIGPGDCDSSWVLLFSHSKVIVMFRYAKCPSHT